MDKIEEIAKIISTKAEVDDNNYGEHEVYNCNELAEDIVKLFAIPVRSASKVIEIGTKVQMTKREWWQIYRKGWHKHNDHWGRKWWIRYNWNT